MSKIQVVISESISELIYDIENVTHITGRSADQGNNPEQVANMQANGDESELNQMLRSIGNAFSYIKTKMSEYLSDTGTTSNNGLTEATIPEPNTGADKDTKPYLDESGVATADKTLAKQIDNVLKITLNMPPNYNRSANDSIANSVHQYMVNKALGDWYKETFPNNAKAYYDLSMQNIVEIREAVSKRARPTRL